MSFFVCSLAHAQKVDSTAHVDQFKTALLTLRADVNNIQLNLGKSERRFKTGIAVATLGYSITIAGGLMLGRKHDDVGKGLLIAGGATGITGTFLMVDAFKFLGRASRKQSP
ncbi:hypothetical protein DQQ10_25155 [Pseudochryseolinea flava]|uniref:Uncharacterized protein n=2 Tax=Pseudochryseolinea flava TaxID=2059302 RepID=A0A364XWP2_9BACT|nr:hypothetical protein DQQ10_25155 [Pseudochryseolinea flava]